MVVKKAEEAPTPEAQVTDITALLQRIEEFLNNPPTRPRLTEEARAALAAPLDPKFLKQRKGPGGKIFTYADLDYLESRVAAVDPDWAIHFDANTPNVLICRVTIHSVPRSAVAGYYIPATYETSKWNPDTRRSETTSHEMSADMSHTIVTRAQAAAERRAMAMFGLGAELWVRNEGEYEADRAAQDTGRPRGGGGGESQGPEGFRAPTEKRIDLLVGMGVPAEVASHINSWSRGKDSNNNPISDVSEVISALFKARGGDKGPVARAVWERVVREHAPYALASQDNDDEDDDF